MISRTSQQPDNIVKAVTPAGITASPLNIDRNIIGGQPTTASNTRSQGGTSTSAQAVDSSKLPMLACVHAAASIFRCDEYLHFR